MIAAFHLIAGVVAGSVFPVQFLLLLMIGTLLECSAAAVVYDLGFGAMLALQLLLVVQVGYLLGIYFRSLAEGWLSATAGRRDSRRSN